MVPLVNIPRVDFPLRTETVFVLQKVGLDGNGSCSRVLVFSCTFVIGPGLDLGRAPYGVHGFKYIDLKSLERSPFAVEQLTARAHAITRSTHGGVRSRDGRGGSGGSGDTVRGRCVGTVTISPISHPGLVGWTQH